MRLDKFSNPIFTEQDIFEASYKGLELSPNMTVSYSNEIESLEEQLGFTFQQPLQQDFLTVEEYDAALQSDWFMPDEYKQLDIENWVLCQAPDVIAYNRVLEELAEYKQRNMLDLLRWLKYFVDTCEKENILWGVGRGSSVASYVLFLLGVHSVDSIKYNLDWQEFLR